MIKECDFTLDSFTNGDIEEQIMLGVHKPDVQIAF